MTKERFRDFAKDGRDELYERSIELASEEAERFRGN